MCYGTLVNEGLTVAEIQEENTLSRDGALLSKEALLLCRPLGIAPLWPCGHSHVLDLDLFEFPVNNFTTCSGENEKFSSTSTMSNNKSLSSGVLPTSRWLLEGVC